MVENQVNRCMNFRFYKEPGLFHTEPKLALWPQRVLCSFFKEPFPHRTKYD